MKSSSSLFNGVLLLSGLLFVFGCGSKDKDIADSNSSINTSKASSKEQFIDPSKIQALVVAQSNLENCLDVSGTICDFGKVKKAIADDWTYFKEYANETTRLIELHIDNKISTQEYVEQEKSIKNDRAKHEEEFRDNFSKYIINCVVLQVKQDGLIVQGIPESKNVYSNTIVFVVGYEKETTAIDGQKIFEILGFPSGRYQYDDNGTTRTLLRFEAGKKPTKPFKTTDVKPLP